MAEEIENPPAAVMGVAGEVPDGFAQRLITAGESFGSHIEVRPVGPEAPVQAQVMRPGIISSDRSGWRGRTRTV
jgi:hypothetical protein